MISRINKILVAILIVVVVTYTVTANLAATKFQVAPGLVLEHGLGVIALIVFGCGFATAGLIGLWLGIRSYLRERRLKNELTLAESASQDLQEARGLIEAEQFSQAQQLLTSKIRRSPGNILYKLELARCFKLCGNLKDAMAVLEAARSQDTDNLEVLLALSDLYRESGNRSAALDQLIRAAKVSGSVAILEKTRDLCFELGDADKALSYHLRTEKLTGNPRRYAAILGALEYSKLLSEGSINLDQILNDTLSPRAMETVRAFSRGHPTCVPALLDLAAIEMHTGSFSESVTLIESSAELSEIPQLWSLCGESWLNLLDPEQASARARLAIKRTTGFNHELVQLELPILLLRQGRIDDSISALTIANSSIVANGDSPRWSWLRLKQSAVQSVIAGGAMGSQKILNAGESLLFAVNNAFPVSELNARSTLPALTSAELELVGLAINRIYKLMDLRFPSFRPSSKPSNVKLLASSSHQAIEVSPVNSTP